MPEERKRVLHLFGDQTSDIPPEIADIIQRTIGHSPLDQLLDRARDAMYAEASKATEPARSELLAKLSNVHQMLQSGSHGSDSEERPIAIDMALTCLCQIAAFIHCWSETGTGLDIGRSRVLGFCTGALAAAAVACSDSISTLLSCGTEAVRVAFKAGMLVSETTRAIVNSPAEPKRPCALGVLGPDAMQALQSFLNDNRIFNDTEKPWIIVKHPLGVSVGGPPSTLSVMRDALSFAEFELRDLPVYGIFHAAHLYSKSAVSSIIKDLDADLGACKSQVTIISGYEGASRADFQAHLLAALEQILRQPVQWNNVFETLEHWAKEVTPQESAIVEPQLCEIVILEYGSQAGNVIAKIPGLTCSHIQRNYKFKLTE